MCQQRGFVPVRRFSLYCACILEIIIWCQTIFWRRCNVYMKRERNERDVADGESNKEKKPSGFTDLVDLEEYVTRGLLDIVREFIIFGIGEILGKDQETSLPSGLDPGLHRVRVHHGSGVRLHPVHDASCQTAHPVQDQHQGQGQEAARRRPRASHSPGGAGGRGSSQGWDP